MEKFQNKKNNIEIQKDKNKGKRLMIKKIETK